MFTCTENMHHRKNGLCESRGIANFWPNFKFAAIFGLSYNKRHFFVFELAITPNFATKSKNFATKDSLGSNYPTVKFSSRNSKFSVFDSLAFFSTIMKTLLSFRSTKFLTICSHYKIRVLKNVFLFQSCLRDASDNWKYLSRHYFCE